MQNGRFLKNITYSLLIFIPLIVTSILFFDRVITDFAYQNNLSKFLIFKWLTYIPEIIFYFAILIVIILSIKKVFNGKITKIFNQLYIFAVTIIVAVAIKDSLKIIFGRYWPATWVNNNPSWISNHAYGFHFFHTGSAYASFPSGHSTIIFTAIAMLWTIYPKLRYLYVIVALAVCVGLLGMCYHFLADIIAGAVLGVLCGRISVKLSKKIN